MPKTDEFIIFFGELVQKAPGMGASEICFVFNLV